MMNKLMLIVLLSLFSTMSFSADNKIGIVILSKGQVSAVNIEGSTRELKRRSEIFEGETIATGANAKTQIRFIDNAILALRENSEIFIKEYHPQAEDVEEKVFMELLEGGFRTITGSLGKSGEASYIVETPAASIGIRGTNYEAVMNGGDVVVGVWQGGISVKNDNGTLSLGIGSGFNFARLSQNKRPIGLLKPPAELQQPLVQPEADTSEETLEQNEATDDETSNGESSSNEEPAPADSETADTTDTTSSSDTSENGEPQITETTNEQTVEATEEIVDLDSLVQALSNAVENEEIVIPNNALGDVTEQLSKAIDESGTDNSELDPLAELLTQLSQSDDFVDTRDDRLSRAEVGELINNKQSGFVVVAGQEDDASPILLASLQSNQNVVLADFSGDNATFNVVYQSDLGTRKTYAITLDKNHSSIDELISDINDDLPQGAYVTVVESPFQENKLMFTVASAQDGSTISVNGFSGDSTGAQFNLEESLGGISDGEVGAMTSITNELGLHFGYVINADNGDPLFINYKNEFLTINDGTYIKPNNVLRGDQVATIVENNSSYDHLSWGYWQADTTKLYDNANDISSSESVGQPVYFVKVDAANPTNLKGTKTLSNVTDFLGQGSAGNVTDVKGNMSVDFSTGFVSGNLDVAVENTQQWNMNYQGDISNSQANINRVWGEVTESTNTLSATGEMGGVFVGNGEGFVGGFDFQAVDVEEGTAPLYTQGVYVIEEAVE